MELRGFFFVAFASLFTVGQAQSPGVWEDIVTCVQGLIDSTDLTALGSKSNMTSNSIDENAPVVKLVSTICRNKDRFVGCLASSLQDSNDSVTQVIGSLFDSTTVVQAYNGLCQNVSAISSQDSQAMDCLSSDTVLACQDEMADFIFYMNFVRKFASSGEQLSRNTMVTLLCSVTMQRVSCEVRALKQCNYQLGIVMETFYFQSRPQVCASRIGGKWGLSTD